MTQNLLFATLLLLAASATALIAVVTWRRGRNLPSGPPLALCCLGLTWWSGALAINWLAAPAPYQLFWIDVCWIGAALVPTAGLLFAVRFIEPYWHIPRPVFVVLALDPLLTILFVFTDPLHGLFFGRPRDPEAGTIMVGGPAYLLHHGYSYFLIGSGCVLLLREFFRVRGLYRRQVGFFLLAVSAPVTVNLLSTFDVNPVYGLDLTPISFAFTSAFLAYGLFRFGLLDVVPVARHALVENMSDGMLVLDGKNRIVDANPAFGRVVDMPPEQLIGRQPSVALVAWADVMARYRGLSEAQDEIVLDEDPPRYLDLRIVPLYQRGQLSGRLVVVRDVSERRRAEDALVRANDLLHAQLQQISSLQEQLREQAIRDPLTGLFNRRYLEETLARELAAMERSGQPLGVAVIDVDFFKKVNDSHGHGGGDHLLLAPSKLLLASTRGGDVISRYGGEEFVVVLPGATAEQAACRVEEWRASFEQLRLPYEGAVLRATLSAGISAYPGQGTSGAELLRAADAALYLAKQSGRNRVVASAAPDPHATQELLPAVVAART